MKDYKEELAKLYAIITQSEEQILTRGYVKEKLEMALFGGGIGLHPTLKPIVKKILKETKK